MDSSNDNVLYLWYSRRYKVDLESNFLHHYTQLLWCFLFEDHFHSGTALSVLFPQLCLHMEGCIHSWDEWEHHNWLLKILLIMHVCWLQTLQTKVPLHVVFLGSGSHSPFPIHVVALGPMRMNSGRQLKVTTVPCITGSLYTLFSINLSFMIKYRQVPNMAYHDYHHFGSRLIIRVIMQIEKYNIHNRLTFCSTNIIIYWTYHKKFHLLTD